MIKPILLATALAFAVPAGGALAHDYSDWGGDQAEHQDFHDEINDAHAEAHAHGFSSEAEHRGYHEALRQLHDGYHDDHPYAYDDRRLPREHRRRYYSNSYSPYYGSGSYYGNGSYYRSRPSYGSGWNYSYGSGW